MCDADLALFADIQSAVAKIGAFKHLGRKTASTPIRLRRVGHEKPQEPFRCYVRFRLFAHFVRAQPRSGHMIFPAPRN